VVPVGVTPEIVRDMKVHPVLVEAGEQEILGEDGLVQIVGDNFCHREILYPEGWQATQSTIPWLNCLIWRLLLLKN